MKLYDNYKCAKCGAVVPVAEVLLPPTDGKVAQEITCKCGAKSWLPVKK